MKRKHSGVKLRIAKKSNMDDLNDDIVDNDSTTSGAQRTAALNKCAPKLEHVSKSALIWEHYWHLINHHVCRDQISFLENGIHSQE